MSESRLSGSGDMCRAAAEPVVPSFDNLRRFELGSSGDDCLLLGRGDCGSSDSTGRRTADDIGL